MSTIEPIKVQCLLANNPPGTPRYAQNIKLCSGEEALFADPKATRAMVALMDMQAVMGGAASHFGGPSAFAELMSALYGVVFHRGNPWYEYAQIINDAGHCENGIYALKANYSYAGLNLESLKGFRSIQSPLTGHGESHLFPEGVYLSNGPLGSSLPQAQGLCLADGLAGRKRITVTAVSDGACMEGEAKEAIAAIPGLTQKGKMAPFVMVVSDNNTKLSGRIDKQSFSMAPSFKSLNEMGWEVLKIEDAHDLQTCVSVVERAFDQTMAERSKPVCIHAKTIKGYGTRGTVESASGGHGFPLKSPTELRGFLEEIYAGEPLPQEFIDWSSEMVATQRATHNKKNNVRREKVQVGVTRAMVDCRKKGLPVISVSSDLPGSTGVAGFQKEFPECAIDVGVAESNMVSVGAGLSKEGFIPIVDTFSQFGVTKGALPLIMASLSEAPVIAIFSHAGFQDAADGASHQALSYLSMTSSIPHTDVYCLATSAEAYALVTQAIEKLARYKREGKVPHSQIFFLGRETFLPNCMEDSYKYELGKSQIVFDNSSEFDKSVTVVAAGPLLHQALMAAKDLQEKSMGTVVIHPSIINRPDMETLFLALEKTSGTLVTVEDHQIIGGLGALTAHALVQSGVNVKMKSLGVKGEFGQSSYTAIELYEKHGMDRSAIVRAVQSLWACIDTHL